MDEIKGLMRDERGTWMVTMRLVKDAEPKPPKARRKRFGLDTKGLLLLRQNHRCAICTGPISLLDSHIDHVFPLSEGGEDDPSNLQLVHMNCNLRKGRRIVVAQGAMPWA